MNGDAAHVLTALAACRKAVQLYPPSHPAHGEAIGSLVRAVRETAGAEGFVLNLHEGRLYHGSLVLPADVHGATAIAGAFEARRIESLAFEPSFGEVDALGLTEVLSLKPSASLDVEAELSARGVHAVTVAVLAEEAGDKEERDRQRAADRAMYERVIAALRRLRERFASGRDADLAETTPLVAGMIERLAADPAAMMGLATMRDVGEHNLFHSLNVMIYTITMGQRLGLGDAELLSLGLSSLLHDVGKAAFDADDPAQAEVARFGHPAAGAEILRRVALEDPAPLLVAYEHNMRVDGGGFPARDGGEIHPYSRMVAVANRYENLTNPAGGSPPVSPDRAVMQVLSEAGTALDPIFARLLATALGVFPVGCVVRLSTHAVAVVAAPGADPLRPLVRVVFDERGLELDEPVEVDLSSSDEYIVEAVDADVLRLEVADKL